MVAKTLKRTETSGCAAGAEAKDAWGNTGEAHNATVLSFYPIFKSIDLQLAMDFDSSPWWPLANWEFPNSDRSHERGSP